MWETEINERFNQLRVRSQIRKLQRADGAVDPYVTLNGKRLLNLASNNYLGLAGHPRLKKAAIEAIDTYGVGATASRLIVGNHPAYEEAEQALLHWKKSEACLIVNSGYVANVGIISALMKRGDFVFSDRLNHASIIDGIVLSRANHHRYRHNDLDHLEAMLKKTPTEKRKLIVTDTIFSMDGDVAPLADLVTLKERYNALLMVDEAHSSGIFGVYGEGISHAFGLADKIDIQMGTFSKAHGTFGAYVVGQKWMIDYLMNTMRSFIFSTALPPSVLGSIKAAIQLVKEENERRKRLLQHSSSFRTQLQAAGFFTYASETQIIPIRVGSSEAALTFSEQLQKAGIAAIAIRPPTVQENDARIRLTVTALHTEKQLQEAAQKVIDIGRSVGVIS